MASVKIMDKGKGAAKSRPPSWDPEIRRQRYREDPKLRERNKYNMRRGYRLMAHGGAVQDNPLDGYEQRLAAGGAQRVVQGRRLKTYSVAEMAALMNKSESVVSRWITYGQLRAPGMSTKQGLRVYSAAEVRAALRVLHEHFGEFSYYRRDHDGTIARVITAMTLAAG